MMVFVYKVQFFFIIISFLRLCILFMFFFTLLFYCLRIFRLPLRPLSLLRCPRPAVPCVFPPLLYPAISLLVAATKGQSKGLWSERGASLTFSLHRSLRFSVEFLFYVKGKEGRCSHPFLFIFSSFFLIILFKSRFLDTALYLFCVSFIKL